MHENDSDVLIRELFDTVDLDSSGYIDEKELAAVVDLSADDLKEIFQKLDTDKDGKISVEEFIENYKQFQKIANENFLNNPEEFLSHKNDGHRKSSDESLFDVSKQTPEEIINRLPRNRDSFYLSGGGGLSGNHRPKRLPLKRDIKRKAARYLGQEYLDDLYEIARARNDPMLIESLENFLTATVDSLLQKQSENEKLDTALKRATEKNTEIAQELEYEMEHQVAMLEAKIREEERLKLEQQKQEANFQILRAQQELSEMEDKVKALEDRVSQKVTEIPDSIINVIQKKEKENEELQKKLLEFQTQMALMRTEVANMKAEYDEQSERLSSERGTVLTCVQEQENLTRQLHLLHEANRKLHDTNDDLRSALDSRRSLSSSFSAGPSSPVKKLFNGTSPIKRHGSSFRSDPGTYNTTSRRKASSIASANSDYNDTDDEFQRSILPEDQEVSIIHPVEHINNESLLSEIMAADGNLYNSPCRGQMTPDSYVSTPIHQSSDREQFVRQLEILCDTNRRLGESNDELRQALGILSDRLRQESSMADMPRPPPTGCQSAPVTPMRKKTESEVPAPRPQSTSSPRKVLLTKSGYHSSMPDLSSECVNEQEVGEKDTEITEKTPTLESKPKNLVEESITKTDVEAAESMPVSSYEIRLRRKTEEKIEIVSSDESSEDSFSNSKNILKSKDRSSNSVTETLDTSAETTRAAPEITTYSDLTKTRDLSETDSDYSFSRNHETTQISLTQDDDTARNLSRSRPRVKDSFDDESELLTNEIIQNEESTIFDDTSHFNETTFMNDVTTFDKSDTRRTIDESTNYPASTHDMTKFTEDEMSNSTSNTLGSLHSKSPTAGKTTSNDSSSSTYMKRPRKCECGNVISNNDYSICDECFDEDTDVVVEEISFDENTASVYSVPGTTIYGKSPQKSPKKSVKSIQCDIDHFLDELNESNITELNKTLNFQQNPSMSHVCNPRFCQCDIQETNLPNEKCTQVSEFMLLQAYEEIEPIEIADDESSMDNIMIEIDKLTEKFPGDVKDKIQHENIFKQSPKTDSPKAKNNVSLDQHKLPNNLTTTKTDSKLDPSPFSLSNATSLNVNPALTTKQNITHPNNLSAQINGQLPVDYCPVCQHVITLHARTGVRQCLCTEDGVDVTFVNKSIHQVAESIILTDSDSNNYSDQESIPDFSPFKRMRPVGSEHEDQDATYETNFGLTKDENTWISNVSSTYSQFQHYEAQLSMYARRQDDEDVDEDDMDDEELIRIVDQTNPDTDDMSASITEEPITVEEKILEPRGNAVGADTSSEVSQDSPLETTIPNKEPDCLYKLVLAGNAAVGKSSFIIRLCKDKFYSALNSTLGVDFQMRSMTVDGANIALQLWDTAGQERFRSIAKSYFRRVDGVVLLYDVTCENSFLDVRDWLESIQSSSSKDIPIIICGNKVDLRPYALKRGMPCVSRAEGEKLAKEVGALFIETSAKDGINVNKACLQLARKLQSMENAEEAVKKGLTLDKNQNIDNTQPKKSGCCK